MKILWINFIYFIVLISNVLSQGLKYQQNTHRALFLPSAEIRYLANLSDTKYLNDILNNILIPRVVGTENHEKVFKYIVNELNSLRWTVDVDEFQENTPKFGKLTFKNIIATSNPQADRNLVLACHYDSKYFPNNDFVGATDSAVPCAMMLNLAKLLNNELKSSESNISLKLIFFDGEEAFVNWGPNDSIYGAKHLASIYHSNKNVAKSTGETVSDLQKIDLFVLLDLIGHRETRFQNYFRDTQNWYLHLADIEQRLKRMGMMKKPNQKYFHERMYFGRIEDDHLPFLEKNVPIVHLISSPFPKEWHTTGDNINIIDRKIVEDVNMILRVFVAEYLHLSIVEEGEEDKIPEKEL